MRFSISEALTNYARMRSEAILSNPLPAVKKPASAVSVLVSELRLLAA
jgi:hypothetical protein